MHVNYEMLKCQLSNRENRCFSLHNKSTSCPHFTDGEIVVLSILSKTHIMQWWRQDQMQCWVLKQCLVLPPRGPHNHTCTCTHTWAHMHTCTHTPLPPDLYLSLQLLHHLELVTKFHSQRGITICPRKLSTDYSFSKLYGQNRYKLCSLLRPNCAWLLKFYIESQTLSRPSLGTF